MVSRISSIDSINGVSDITLKNPYSWGKYGHQCVRCRNRTNRRGCLEWLSHVVMPGAHGGCHNNHQKESHRLSARPNKKSAEVSIPSFSKCFPTPRFWDTTKCCNSSFKTVKSKSISWYMLKVSPHLYYLYEKEHLDSIAWWENIQQTTGHV